MKHYFNPLRLPGRMVLSFIAVVLLTAAAIGLPATWLIHNQLEQQAWTQVVQGRQVTLALIQARQDYLNGAASLAAKNPSLINSISGSHPESASPVLSDITASASLDTALICIPGGNILSQSGKPVPLESCALPAIEGFYQPSEGQPIWLLSQRAPVISGTHQLADVLVGMVVDERFISSLRDQTGMEQAVIMDGRPAIASFKEYPATWNQIQPVDNEDAPINSLRFNAVINGFPYNAIRFPLKGNNAEGLIAQPAINLATTQREITISLIQGILAVVVFGSFFGILLARPISLALGEVRRAAVSLRRGQLDQPIAIKARLPEIAVIGYTLEDARAALQHSLSELQREKAWMEHLLEAIVEGILTLDQHGRITFFSHGAEKITGWAQNMVIGRLCDDVFQSTEGGAQFSQLVLTPGRQQKVTVIVRNGRQVTLAVTRASLAPPEAGVARVVLVLRDVSDEEALHRLLGDFLANIAHEFRTPLSALAASIELLLDQLPDLSPWELEELLNSLHLGILSLQTLIDNLLEGASIETGRFRVYQRPCSLEEIVNEAVRLTQPIMNKYRLKLTVQLPPGLPPMLADPRRTVQVLVNLLSNAVKYSPSGGEITLSAAIKEGEILISLGDQGPGISPEIQAGIFRRFVHLETGDERARDGVGLGLSVVKAIIEAQGGQVGVANRPAGGAMFWFTLPYDRKVEAV